MRLFLLWLFPDLQAELNALRSGNTKLVLENQRLLDRKMIPEISFDPTNHHNALKCPYCNPRFRKFSDAD